jgi:hypothetical protein
MCPSACHILLPACSAVLWRWVLSFCVTLVPACSLCLTYVECNHATPGVPVLWCLSMGTVAGLCTANSIDFVLLSQILRLYLLAVFCSCVPCCLYLPTTLVLHFCTGLLLGWTELHLECFCTTFCAAFCAMTFLIACPGWFSGCHCRSPVLVLPYCLPLFACHRCYSPSAIYLGFMGLLLLWVEAAGLAIL